MEFERCAGCPLLWCDSLSPLCQLTPEEKLEMHKDEQKREAWHQHLIRISPLGHAARRKPFVPETGMAVKYDRRRKPDTPERQRHRLYRRRKAVERRESVEI